MGLVLVLRGHGCPQAAAAAPAHTGSLTSARSRSHGVSACMPPALETDPHGSPWRRVMERWGWAEVMLLSTPWCTLQWKRVRKSPWEFRAP